MQEKKPVAPPEFKADAIDVMGEAEAIALLTKADSTIFQKAKACQRLSRIGTAKAVPAIAPLLANPQLSAYARNALQSIPGDPSNEALRAAAGKLTGILQVGVINSLGVNRDRGAVPLLSKLLAANDQATAQAAAAALGHISGPDSAKTLQAALKHSQGPMRTAVADASLICAEGLLASGDRDAALNMYNTLTAPDVPKPMRLAAMHGIINAETSLGRPREKAPAK